MSDDYDHEFGESDDDHDHEFGEMSDDHDHTNISPPTTFCEENMAARIFPQIENRKMFKMKPKEKDDSYDEVQANLFQFSKGMKILDVVQLCETQIFKFVLCEAVNKSSFSAS